MSAENVVINFVGDTSGLQPVENVLENIVEQGGEVGKQWGKTAALLNANNKSSADSTNKLAKSIEQMSIAAKSMDKAVIGGAYKEYLVQIKAQLGLTNKELIAYVQNARKSAQQAIFEASTDEEISQITMSIEAMNEQLKELGAWEDETVVKTQSLKAQLRAMKEELAGMDEGTPAFEELKKKAGELDDKIKDVNATISHTGSDTKNVEGVISAVSGLAGGFAVAQGAAALFGGESEEVQKALLKVNAAMSILQGLEQIQQVMQKESAATLLLTRLFYKQKTVAINENTASTELNVVAEGEQAAASAAVVVAEGAQVAATEAATAAQLELNAAMMLNPAALIIAAIVAIAAAVYMFSQNNKAAEETQRKLNDAIEEATVILDIDLKALEHQTAMQVALAKQRGASVTELASIEGNASVKRLKEIDAARVAAATAFNAAKDDDEKTVELKGKLHEEIIKLEKQYQEELNAVNVKNIEFRTQKAEDEYKSFVGFQEAKVAATIQGSDNERSVQVATIRAIAAEREKQASFIALTEGEKAKQRADDERQIQGLQLANYQHYLKGKTASEESNLASAKAMLLRNEVDTIESITKVTDIEIEAEKKRQKEALSNPTLNKGEQQKIKQETDLKILELEKQKQLTILEIQKSGINAQLILSAKGSYEEFSNKISLIEKEQQIELSAKELSVEKIAEINAKAEIAKEQAIKERQLVRLQFDKTLLDMEVENAVAGSNAELAVKVKQLDAATKLEIENIDERVKLTEEGKRKIDEINNRNKNEKIRLQLDFDLKKIDIGKQLFDSVNAAAISADQRIVDSLNSTTKQRKQAEEDIYKLKIKGFENEKNIINQKILKEEEAAQKIKGAVALTAEEKLAIEQKYQADLTGLEDKEAQSRFDNEQKALRKKAALFAAVIDSTKAILQESINVTMDTSAAKTALLQLTDLADSVFKTLADTTLTEEQKTQAIVSSAIAAGQQIVNQIFADSAAARQQALADTIASLEDAKAKELNNKNLTEQQKADIEKKYKEKERQEKIKAFNADKEAKKEQAVINGLLAITNVWASNAGNPILAAILTALTIANTAIQVSKINSTQPPKFRHGQVDIQGPGTTTSDSIPALISKGESVIKADATAKWKDALIAINNDAFEPYLFDLFKDFVFPKVPDNIQPLSAAPAIDYDKLAMAVANKMAGIIPAPTQVHNTIDSDGLHSFIKNGNSKTEIKNQYFSMT
jgi:hypothetical protein